MRSVFNLDSHNFSDQVFQSDPDFLQLLPDTPLLRELRFRELQSELHQDRNHTQFVERMLTYQTEVGDFEDISHIVFSDIMFCGRRVPATTRAGTATIRISRCDLPYCPTCGLRLRDQAIKPIIEFVRNAIQVHGRSAVSVLHLNGPLVPAWNIKTAFKDLSKKIENCIRRNLLTISPDVQALGELELEVPPCGLESEENTACQDQIEAMLVDAVKAFQTGGQTVVKQDGIQERVETLGVRPHFHGWLVHPGLKRPKVQSALKRSWPKGHQVITAIRNRNKKGETVDGIANFASYLADKSQALKKDHRWKNTRIVAQALALQCYAVLTGDTRRRLRFSFGLDDGA